MDDEKATCRGCGRDLIGKPYWAGGSAYVPGPKRKPAGTCFYGGYVCSRECDVKACLELEQTMPGHGYHQRRPLDSTMRTIDRNWRDSV